MKKLLFAVAMLAGCVNQGAPSDDPATGQTEIVNAEAQAVTIPEELVDPNARPGCLPCDTDTYCRNTPNHCGPLCVADPAGGPDHCGQLPP